MSSREQILSAIKGIERESKQLPDIPEFPQTENLQKVFKDSIQGNKGEVLSAIEFEEWIASLGDQKIISVSSRFPNLSTIKLPSDPHQLNDLNLAIIDGQFGVSENGAIWLEEENLKLRALPFITEHLVIVLDSQKLVPSMHQAYESIGSKHSGFGLFIAGPSKTADIEQSLVIGAHGAKSLRVVLL
ncbi:LUD domain-containing protein [Algoriphagus sp. CAU 1675]|uniref:LutC/YkgG family protein n=1 Tax=Algoriphagus sp. CAU 1675 TaxID=3032597 RepID=UPI0023DA3111|nr:LUD domain-containing protein [Algoriphagus sp. CAU 1675]MDF2159153.1 LUD domain-containing protein [Algoriphagus sp. CAU 1675]